MTTNPKIDPWRFDGVIQGKVSKAEKLWGAPAIASALGVSVDKVRHLATVPDAPVYRPAGCGYFAFRSELEQWLRSKPAA